MKKLAYGWLRATMFLGLIEKLKVIIPELLEANGVRIDQEVPFEVLTRRFEIAQTAGI